MTRQKPLVTQHLEKISRKALEKFQDIIRKKIRKRPGIYALYRKDKLYYVGLANNLRNRLRTHLRDHHGESWDSFSVYLTIGNEHMKELETLLLRIIPLEGNRVKGKFAKSENLERTVRKEYQARLKEELKQLMGEKGKAASRKKPAKKTTRKSKVTGRKPVLAPYITSGFKIRCTYKGKTHRAFVRKDGTIRYKGKIHNSPSGAARAILKRSCGSWSFWKYERSPGDWVKLRELK